MLAREGLIVSSAVVALVLVACQGGPGNFNQGSDTGNQYDGISNSTNDESASVTNQGGSPSVSTSSTSSSASSSGTTVTTPLPKDLAASDYTLTCANNTDCVAIYQGPVCTPCACPNAAIAEGSEPTYESDQAIRHASCPASTTPTACGTCASAAVHCDPGSHKCAFGAGH